MPKMKRGDITVIDQLIRDANGLFRGTSAEYRELIRQYQTLKDHFEGKNTLDDEQLAARESELHEAARRYYNSRLPEEESETRRLHMKVARYLFEHTGPAAEREEAAAEEDVLLIAEVQEAGEQLQESKPPFEDMFELFPSKAPGELSEMQKTPLVRKNANEAFFRDFRIIRAMLEARFLDNMPPMTGDAATENEKETNILLRDNLFRYRDSMKLLIEAETGMSSDDGNYVLTEEMKNAMRGALTYCDLREKEISGRHTLQNREGKTQEQLGQAWEDVIVGRRINARLVNEKGENSLSSYVSLADGTEVEKERHNIAKVIEMEKGAEEEAKLNKKREEREKEFAGESANEKKTTKRKVSYHSVYTPLVDLRKKLDTMKGSLTTARTGYGMDSYEYNEMMRTVQELREEINTNPKLLGGRIGDVDYNDPGFVQKFKEMKAAAAAYFGKKLAQKINDGRRAKMDIAEKIMTMKPIGEADEKPVQNAGSDWLKREGEDFESFIRSLTEEFTGKDFTDRNTVDEFLVRTEAFPAKGQWRPYEELVVMKGGEPRAVSKDEQQQLIKGARFIRDTILQERKGWETLKNAKGKTEEEILLAKRDVVLGQSLRNKLTGMIRKSGDPVKLLCAFDMKEVEITKLRTELLQHARVDKAVKDIRADEETKDFTLANEL